MMHHVSHRGYDRVPGVPPRYTSGVFARGWRRFIDWPEWIHPEAWAHEHNVLHHYHTGEALDPDLLERNAALLRNPRVPLLLRYLAAIFIMATWKLLYYAPNTLAVSRDRTRAPYVGRLFPGARLWNPTTRGGAAFWMRCVLPYATYRFGIIPALFLPVSTRAWACVLINSLLAEVIANLHTFAIIVPNHAGADVTRFDDSPRKKEDFFVRQIIGSVNYTGGSDVADFLQGYLNYQIEHHLFPDLPLLSYREIQAEVKASCRRHGVAYVSEPVLRRFAKMLDIMVGRASMRAPV